MANIKAMASIRTFIYAFVINAKEAPLENYWSIVDGTVKLARRPQEDQRIVYNGHNCMVPNYDLRWHKMDW